MYANHAHRDLHHYVLINVQNYTFFWQELTSAKEINLTTCVTMVVTIVMTFLIIYTNAHLH